MMNTRFLPYCLLLVAGVLPAQIPFAKKLIIGDYPVLATLAHLEGTVALELSIEKGNVISYSFLSGPPQFQKAEVLAHIKDWKFTPDCPSKLSMKIEFSLFELGDSKKTHRSDFKRVEFEYPDTIRVIAPKPPPTERETLPVATKP